MSYGVEGLKYNITYNKVFSGYQPRQAVKWRKKQRFGDRIRPLDAAGSLRKLYYT
jgi:hypothetical protein